MTLDELDKHLSLVVDLAKSREMLQSLWNTAHPGGQVMTGMPHTPGVKDKVGDLAVEIADLESEIVAMEQRCKESEAQVRSFLSTISNTRTRLIFRLRFCRGMQWKEVASTIGGWQTEASVKETAYRYLRRKEQEAKGGTVKNG